jgi:hypothetical protein
MMMDDVGSGSGIALLANETVAQVQSSPWLTLRRFFGLLPVELWPVVRAGGDCESAASRCATAPAEPSTCLSRMTVTGLATPLLFGDIWTSVILDETEGFVR